MPKNQYKIKKKTAQDPCLCRRVCFKKTIAKTFANFQIKYGKSIKHCGNK